jgi:hypothetical protein
MAKLWQPKSRPAAPGGVSNRPRPAVGLRRGAQLRNQANQHSQALKQRPGKRFSPEKYLFNWGGGKSPQAGIEEYMYGQVPSRNSNPQPGWLDQVMQPADPGGGEGYGYDGWGGGGGGGGGGSPAPITWSAFDSGVSGPAWWKAMKPSEVNEGTEAVAAMNMLIPFLSPEDQKTVAANIYGMNAADFGHLNPEGITVPQSTELNQQTVNQFTSAERAGKALEALTALAKAAGKDEKGMGVGYRYLKSILDAGKQYGGANGAGQTRRQYQQMMSALDPLLAQSKDPQLGAYASLANMLARPYFNQGQLTPMSKTQDGQYVFGQANKSLL